MTTATEINYYEFDSIDRDEDGQYWGHLNGQSVEVFEIEGDTDEQLISKGFAKCDAPEGFTHTLCVREDDWAEIAPKMPLS